VMDAARVFSLSGDPQNQRAFVILFLTLRARNEGSSYVPFPPPLSRDARSGTGVFMPSLLFRFELRVKNRERMTERDRFLPPPLLFPARNRYGRKVPVFFSFSPTCGRTLSLPPLPPFLSFPWNPNNRAGSRFFIFFPRSLTFAIG